MNVLNELLPVFQVSEFNEMVNNHLGLLGEVTIEGEISRIDIKNGRLLFITIKDKDSALDLFGLTHIVRNYRELEEGMMVQVSGTAGLYKGSSKFRLSASSITPQGEGALQIAFEKLKARLEAEGLFDPSHKRSLPAWPTNIGVITATNSSAYHDVVKILSARMSGLTIKHLPVTVQGAQAVGTLKKAFVYCNDCADQFDVLILARGGGSAEDLAAFNDEELARLVFALKIPIVSAVGHEDDWTLIDYVADVRASTPSNAAELVVRDRREVLMEIDALVDYMKVKLDREITQYSHNLDQLMSVLKAELYKPAQKISLLLQRFELQGVKLRQDVQTFKQKLEQQQTLLQALSYEATLKRGFSITFDESGKLIKDSSNIKENQKVRTTLAQGTFDSKVTHVRLADVLVTEK